MNYDNLLKWAGAAVLFGAWLALVILKMTSIEPFVTFVSLSLAGFAGHGLTVSGQKSKDKASPPKVMLPNGTERPALYVPGQQGRMLLSLLAILASLALLVGCAGTPGASGPSTAQVIREACAADAGLRPSVSILLAIPGLANPAEQAAIVAARAVIDPICANPDAPFPSDPTAALTQATATIAGLAVTLETRKAAK